MPLKIEIEIKTALTLTVLPLPTLSIQRGPANQVVLTWPSDYSGFSLLTATTLGGSPNWGPATPAPAAAGSVFAFTNSVGSTGRYFRLKQD